ncbi:hypothetical protein B0J13DRAFT_104760 [Dactylonectria estremocensis]|uniref:Uncharacterized protein n=1 Tax=Dactylonectria estremocensis TaxID=1079267 RepID=A0A9P9E5H3_9HYPO|nr:hypothetical protein B0J13DRAFT_104760 [Dactylonectria estremocensis]
MGLHLGENKAKPVSCWQYRNGKANITLDKILELNQFLADRGDFDDELETLLYLAGPLYNHVLLYLPSMMWIVLGLMQIVKKMALLDFDQFATTIGFRIPNWDSIDMGVLLNILTAQDLVSPRYFWAQQPEEPYPDSFHFQYVSRLMRKAIFGSGSVSISDERLLARWLFTGSSPEEVIRVNGLDNSFLISAYEFHWNDLLPLLGRMRGYDPLKGDITVRYMPLVMQMWLEDLMEAGMDLEAFGRLEESFFPASFQERKIEILGG